jgi:HD superfamily phosphohydrolase
MAPLGLSQDEGGAGDVRLVLCYPEKQAGEAMEAFATRNSMHDKVYQHRKVLAMDEMVTDVLLLASEVKVRTRSDPNELAPDLPVRLK